MAVKTQIAPGAEGGIFTISLDGRFDINSYKEFTQAYTANTEPVSTYVLDMREVEYMDSSALGMILMLRERTAGKARIEILNCSPGILKILKTAKFDKLFRVE